MAVNPSSDYGKLKNEIETYLRVKKSANNMSKIILRITNGYGYPIHNLSDCWNLVVMNICKQAIENGEIKQTIVVRGSIEDSIFNFGNEN